MATAIKAPPAVGPFWGGIRPARDFASPSTPSLAVCWRSTATEAPTPWLLTYNRRTRGKLRMDSARGTFSVTRPGVWTQVGCSSKRKNSQLLTISPETCAVSDLESLLLKSPDTSELAHGPRAVSGQRVGRNASRRGPGMLVEVAVRAPVSTGSCRLMNRAASRPRLSLSTSAVGRGRRADQRQRGPDGG